MAGSQTAIEEGYHGARERWPDIRVAQTDYEEHVSRHAGATDPANLHLTDLYLALGCLRGDANAVATFERDILRPAIGAVRSLDAAPAFVDEIGQRTRDRLLVSASGEPRIALYAGRGPLRSWVSVTAVREGLTVLRAGARESKRGDDWAGALAAPAVPDPELAYLKERYADSFTRAFEKACANLDSRNRVLLRMSFAEGLSIDQIGAAYGVHRATAARWLAKARDLLFEATRKALQDELDLSASEFESLVRLVRSQVDVSLSQLLSSDHG